MLKKFYNNDIIETPYHRKIQADQHHALNYLIQSTASDMFLRRMVEIDRMLEVFYNEGPWLHLYFQPDFYGVSNRVNWNPRRDEKVDLFNATLK